MVLAVKSCGGGHPLMPFLFFDQRLIAQAAGIRKDPALPHERDTAWAFYLERRVFNGRYHT